MIRKLYEKPQLEIAKIDVEDIITASTGLKNGGTGSGEITDWGELFPN